MNEMDAAFVGAELEGFGHEVDAIFVKVEQLEQSVGEIEQFYLKLKKKHPNATKGSSIVKDEETRDVPTPSIKKQQQQQQQAAAANRMQELMLHLISHQDSEALRLHDYYEVIDNPMDLTTIRHKIEAKDGTGYNNVREICSDVRLVFKNAMKYNEHTSDAYVMAKSLLAKFEDKWLQFLPKVTEEEKRREKEEAEARLDMHLSQAATQAKRAREISNEIYEVDMQLEELRELVVQNYRKITTEEKRKLSAALTKLSPEDLCKALEIVAENNPSFQATAEEVDLDIDAQSETTLWRLKFFVKGALEVQAKSSASTGGGNNQNHTNNNNTNSNKRKKEICEAIARTAKKRIKKP